MKTSTLIKLPHQPNLRADVAWSLFQVLERGRSAREILPAGLSRHPKQKDKAWFQECFYGCLRDLPKLQYWAHSHLQKPLQHENKLIEHLIMQGFYQLHYMRTPDHAAISETVNAVKLLGKPKLSGLVNAVLRGFLRNNTAQLSITQPHVKYGFPKWMLKKLQTHYPQQWESIVAACNSRAPIFLRINPSKTSAQDYSVVLTQHEIAHEVVSHQTVKLTRSYNIVDLPGFSSGVFSVQDFAAQQAPALLAPCAGDRVLDCCAAPGGKTTGILEYCPTLDKLYALDNSSERLERLYENLHRLGHSQDKVIVIVDDASEMAAPQLDKQFDRILLDAPCSASGIIRRYPDIKWLRKQTDIDALVALQQKIINQAWQQLKEGGTLLYATCSILPEENSEQITRFLQLHKQDAELVPILEDESESNPGWQILPGEQDMDGFYYARIKKLTKR